MTQTPVTFSEDFLTAFFSCHRRCVFCIKVHSGAIRDGSHGDDFDARSGDHGVGDTFDP
jgi:hypothetical protein